MTTLRWLHFTDLHIDKQDDARRQLAGDLFREDLGRVSRKLGPWDVVVFTGDLAFSGREDQYKLLDKELERIWGLFHDVHPKAPRLPYLLAVPGNHDLARPAKGNAIARGLVRDADAREALWRGEADNLEPVRRWFAAYADWWKRCKLRPPVIEEGLLPGDFAYVLEKEDAKFGFVGMNSAFLDLADDVGEGGLWMDARQIQPACGGDLVTWLERCNLAFLLTHHPPAWFAPKSSDNENPVFFTEKQFAAHLCGHLHEALFETRKLGGGDARRIWQAASLFGVQKLGSGELDRKYGYTAGHLELGPGGARVTTFPRLAARLQDRSYRFTADFTFALEDDLAHSRAEALPVRSISLPAPAPELPAAVATHAPATWAEAIERSPLWQVLERGDAARATALKHLAADITRAAWTVWGQAEKALPGDLWRDERYPLRVLDRLPLLIAPGDAGPEETFILLVAPFIREAILAAGTLWMAAADPLDLEGRGSATEPRTTLEQVHRSRGDLVRHAASLAGEARDAVCFWMMEQALQRSPHLWSRKPTVKPVQELFRAIERRRDAAGAKAWLDLERLLRLARAVGVNPDALDAEGGIGRDAEEITVGGVHLRVPVLSYLLCTAGWQALDLREMDEVAVDHVGRDTGSAPAILREALREARWSARDDRHVLSHACPHPVVDFVLRELVERADAVLERTRAKFEAASNSPLALLRRLPKRFSADDVRPTTAADGRPPYALPHVRFRLDHHRIRELLMGAQLYGEPALAIRELYQNALDACRYRRARGEYLERTGSFTQKHYQGRIAFRQDVDERGRTYIECTDNGVGMTKSVIERVFSVAGRRFHDMPDFVEERALWQRCKPPIELYPNSQFGIGVLSYFMLADEVTLWTRRYEADGSLGEPIVVHISSASGLFRLEEGRDEEMPEAGTRLRLYMASTTYRTKYGREVSISCLSTLGRLLWVAEFATSVEEGSEELVWKPGELTRTQLKGSKPQPVRPTNDPDIWWCPGKDGMLLCDGLVTESRHACVIANLHGPRYPEMTIDRKRIHRWSQDWLNRVMEESWQTLIGWDELRFDFLWGLEQVSLRVTRQLVDVLSNHEASFWSQGTRLSAMSDSLSTPRRIPLPRVGCCCLDGSLSKRFNEISKMEASDLSIVIAWRVMTWANTGARRLVTDWPPSSLLDKACDLVAAPGDAVLLSQHEDLRLASETYLTVGEADVWLEGEVPRLHLVRVALQLGLKPSAVLRRIEELAPLGITPPPIDASTIDQLEITKEDWHLLSLELSGEYPWLESRVPPGHILAASHQLNIKPSKVVGRLIALAPLGIKPPSVDVVALDQLETTKEDLKLLSYQFDGRSPWIDRETRLLGHILRAIYIFKIPARSVLAGLARLKPFGLTPPDVDASAFDSLELSDDDTRVLCRILNGIEAWLESKNPERGLLMAAKSLGLSPAEGMDRLTRLVPLGLKLPKLDVGGLERLETSEEEWTLLSYDLLPFSLDRVTPWIVPPAPLLHFIRAAKKLNHSLSHILTLAVRLGIASDELGARTEILGDYAPDKVDERLCSAFDSIRGPDAAVAFQRGQERARYRLWYLSQEQFDARVERMRPLIEVSLRERFQSRHRPKPTK